MPSSNSAVTMSAEDLEASVCYEELEDIEDEFEEVELELIRQQVKLTKDLYAKREKIIAKIPNFWRLVLEKSPPDIDVYIQPTDAALLASLKSLSVERFELPDGDPRSLYFKFEFADNEYLEEMVLEKKFWWRHAKNGWAGLVSDPVDIKWKADKDLTGGMLTLAHKVWQEDKEGKTGETEIKKKLKEQMEKTGLGGLSFFAWFGFRGRDVSVEEDREALKVEQERRQARKEGKETAEEDEEDDEEDDDDDDYDEQPELEIFPPAEDLAVAIAEDLWPGAIDYFTEAQEQEPASDMDFESDDGDDGADGDEGDGGAGAEAGAEGAEKPPQKKRKA